MTAIILGGNGSDIIQGNGGDDVIDGDAWLNVRISVRSLADHNVEITSADSMTQLVDAMVAGLYNPSQLQSVREILYSPTANFDTAKFSGVLADYTISTVGGITTVTDGVAGRDGTDRLTHIERLQFSDQALVLGGLNHAPVGLLTISDPTPTENQLLTVSIAGVTDADNISATNPTGAITPPIAYFWQEEENPGSGVFTDIMFFQSGETGRAEGTSFTPVDGPSLIVAPQVGLALRVRAVYKDGNGVLEEVFSAPTAPVANINDPPVGTVVISDTTPTEGHALTATNAFTDADGLTTAVFAYQWFRSNLAGTILTPIAGATAATYTPVQADVGGRLQVRVSYVDDHGTAETVASALTGGVGDLIIGTTAAETLTGTAFDDDISGLAGNDTINALAGDDLITGGTGNDTLNGGDGNDTFTDTLGDGADTVNGGAGTDTLNIIGTAAAETLTVVFNGTALTSVAGGTVTGVEAVTANLAGGTDTLNYGATTAAVTVNLTSGSASGFATIANIENVTGGAGNDTLTGSAGANALTGGAGDDRFIATVNDGNDTYTGGAGTDTYDLSLTTAGATVAPAAGTNLSATSAEIGTDTLATIENIIGSQGNDTITVGGGVNVIDGQGGDDTINGGAGNDTLTGGLGNDTLLGSAGNDTLNGGLGNDVLSGGLGNDTLNGQAGTDTLTGGAGTDTFVFATPAEAGNGATRDLITDIEGAGVAGGDVINVNAIDANTVAAGNQNFTFVGTGPFTAVGQLRYFQDTVNTLTIVEGNVLGTTGAEFQVAVSGLRTFVAGDFTL